MTVAFFVESFSFPLILTSFYPQTDIEERKIPLTPGVDPLDLLTNDGNNAKMTSEGLPADRISLENGSVITNCKRWPLIIDPQQQVSWPVGFRPREESGV